MSESTISTSPVIQDTFSKIPPLQVTIKTPQAFLFKGIAVAVSCINETGPFDIIPFHANFISLIKDYILLYETKTKIRKIVIEQGIVKVFENTVDIFVGIQTIS